MVSWFEDEARSLDNSVDEFGEPFRLIPYRAKVNFAPQPDPTRPNVYFDGVFERDPKTVQLGLAETGVSTRHLCITARRSEAGDVRQGDRICQLATGDIFEAVDLKPDSASGIEIRVVQLGRT